MVREADVTFGQIGAHREEFDVRAPDGAMLRGWKVRAAAPSGSWILVFHGVADNRYGVTEHARLLLQRGYGVVMMDSRAHGASGGEMASYGWFERRDTRAVIDELERVEHPNHMYALGISMGAGITLQAAGNDARIEAVAAEAPFANLQEAAYDYAPMLDVRRRGKNQKALGLRGEGATSFEPEPGVQ
jgi:alpha-beta hydrolase superfamily lysophospholipase